VGFCRCTAQKLFQRYGSTIGLFYRDCSYTGCADCRRMFHDRYCLDEFAFKSNSTTYAFDFGRGHQRKQELLGHWSTGNGELTSQFTPHPCHLSNLQDMVCILGEFRTVGCRPQQLYARTLLDRGDIIVNDRCGYTQLLCRGILATFGTYGLENLQLPSRYRMSIDNLGRYYFDVHMEVNGQRYKVTFHIPYFAHARLLIRREYITNRWGILEELLKRS